MARAEDSFTGAALDLAWSQWTSLGVRGGALAPDTAVDPEALAYFTASLVDLDPRLRDEARDWWMRFQHHISRPRLSRLARRFDPEVVAKFKKFETAASASRRSSGKSRLERLDHPARSLLRLRCVFGASARAEILLALFTEWQGSDGATVLALSEVGYSKRNIALVLNDLSLAGIVVSSREGNRARYRLADASALDRLVGPLPTRPGRWHLRLPIIADFIELSRRMRGKEATIQAIEARKFARARKPLFTALGLTLPSSSIAEHYWAELSRWLIHSVIAEPTDSTRRLGGMIEGAWVGPEQEVRRPVQSCSAVLPRLTADPLRDDELLCLDLVQVPTADPPGDWAWGVLSDLATNVYAHSIGIDSGERWRFTTWEMEQPRTYVASYAEPIAYEQIAEVYGVDAAACARRDRPAVQRRLKRAT